MNMENRPIQTWSWRTLVLVLLSLTMTLNASQVMTLCVRPDGRVALEPVVHGHCSCDTPSPGTDANGVLVSVTSYVADEHSQPCTDLSIPLGSCNGRTAPVTSKATSGGLFAILPFPMLPTCHAIDITSPDPPPAPVWHCIPLDSIVLKV